MELIGIPHRVVVSDRGIEAGTVEYAARRDGVKAEVSRQDILRFLQARCNAKPGVTHNRAKPRAWPVVLVLACLRHGRRQRTSILNCVKR